LVCVRGTLGLEIAVHNDRGVTWRNPTAGGEQEQQIMNRYLAQARRAQLKWPRSARMLRRIAQAYASEAHMNDHDAELREDSRYDLTQKPTTN
jgi:chorismate mutase